MFRDVSDSVLVLDEPSVGGDSRAFTLAFLMLIHPCRMFFEVAEVFGTMEALAESGPAAMSGKVPEPQRVKTLAVLEKLFANKAFADSFPYSTKSAAALRQVAEDPSTPVWKLAERYRDFCRRMKDELEEDLYVQVRPELVRFTMRPSDGWSKTLARFSDASDDVLQASQCFGLERFTASVFHSMRVLEHGLGGLAAKFNVSFQTDSWHKVIKGIEDGITALRNKQGLTDQDRSDIQAYSEAAAEFRHFKDAWRNHVSHNKEKYDGNQAASVLTHVRDFMEKIAAVV